MANFFYVFNFKKAQFRQEQHRRAASALEGD